ncbi:MAG: hypothetical protein JWN48_1823 [Myxococcaceae bacterium]|nr:hypothetical protein [Myxococcaceae bacterium]
MKKAILMGCALLVLGCSSASVAAREVKSALSAVQSAQSAGAEKDPEAAPRLAQAQSEATRAQNLLKGGDSSSAKSAAETAFQYAEEALKIVRAKAGTGAAQAAASSMP